jgi:hypothetical protein
MTSDDRSSYLSGGGGDGLSPAERAELDELRRVLAEPAVWVEPPQHLQERVVAAIADAGPGRPSQRGAGGRRRWIPYAIVGAAAALLLAIGITVVASGHQSRPVQYAASLTGTALVPDAFGDVTLTRTTSGWRIQLHATGLPRRDNGAYYEAWLKSRSGVLVPIGTFNQGDDVTLWSAVPPSSYPTLTVTRQVTSGDQSSSGQVVVVGTAHRTH